MKPRWDTYVPYLSIIIFVVLDIFCKIMKLYERTLPEGEDQDHIPANLVHHFLLAICTRPGTGICFKDRGWYPRESDPDDIVVKDEDDGKSRHGKIYNKILSNILKTLKVNEDSRQQELAIKILGACPELVSGYRIFFLLFQSSSHIFLATGPPQR